jgi:hypothetical protein
MIQEDIIKIIDSYWGFDESQRHTHTWHDKQDCIERIKEELPKLLEKYMRQNTMKFNHWLNKNGWIGSTTSNYVKFGIRESKTFSDLYQHFKVVQESKHAKKENL